MRYWGYCKAMSEEQPVDKLWVDCELLSGLAGRPRQHWRAPFVVVGLVGFMVFQCC